MCYCVICLLVAFFCGLYSIYMLRLPQMTSYKGEVKLSIVGNNGVGKSGM